MAGYTGPYKGTFKYGSSGKDCAAVKRCLKRLQKNNAIRLSRKFGKPAADALKRFQKNHDLTPDGVYGPKTHAKLAPRMRGYEVLLYKQAKPRAKVRASWVITAPNADRAGKPTHQSVRDFVSKVAHEYGEVLTITCGTNHNRYVLGTNRESQHWQGNAADIAKYGASLTKLGQAALRAAGMTKAQAAQCRGGVYNINGKNILFNTRVGGNHYNHLHVGI
jgi:hypothetical protein